MKGMYLEDEMRSFGFWNAVVDRFVSLNGFYIFDTVQEFEDAWDKTCQIDYERLKSLISESWHDYKKTQN